MLNGLITIQELTAQDILQILDRAAQFKNGLKQRSLANKVIGSCFFEASTRTRLSFEAAIAHLGGTSIGFADNLATSQAAKGESLVDTIKIISGYVDGLIIRHPNDGAARLAAEIADIPIINAGDGANQHPTQTLVDLFTMRNKHGSLNGLKLGLMGDLRHSRAISSLLDASKYFNMHLFLVAPAILQLSSDVLSNLQQAQVNYSVHTDIAEVIAELDCLYVTRLQKERMAEVVDCQYGINLALLAQAKPHLQLLHPLPRLDELPTELDSSPHADYFQQARNGVYVREAVLDLIFGRYI